MELENLLGDELLDWLQGDSDGTEIDAILTAAIDDYENARGELHSLQSVPELNRDGSAPQTSSSLSASNNSRPFARVKTDTEIELARATGVPKKTQEDTKYCVNLWDAWTRYRLETTGPQRAAALVDTLCP